GGATAEGLEPSRLSALVWLHRGAAAASGRLQSDRRQACAEDARARARAARGQRGARRRLLPDRGDGVSQVRKALGPVGFALLPICCLGVPLLIAAGVSVAALALIAGITLAVIVCAAIVLLIVRGAPTSVPWRRPSASARGARRS